MFSGAVFLAFFIYLLMHPRPDMGPLLFVSGCVGSMWTIGPLLYGAGVWK